MLFLCVILETNPVRVWKEPEYMTTDNLKNHGKMFELLCWPHFIQQQSNSPLSGSKLNLEGGQHCCLQLFHRLDARGKFCKRQSPALREDFGLQTANAHRPEIFFYAVGKSKTLFSLSYLVVISVLGTRDIILGRILYNWREKVKSRRNFVSCGTAKILSGCY